MKTFILLLTLSLIAVAPAVSAANSAVQPPPVSFRGTWKTIAGGTHQYTVILKQIGKNVTGSYAPGNGIIFDGVVSDDKLTFKWTQDGGFEGTAVFTMDEDRKGFTGSSTAVKPREFTVTWSTYKPTVSSFAGTWDTITNGQHHFVLTMVQTGTSVTGVYPRGNGKIEGTVAGRVLRFKWNSDGGSGSGRLVMDETEKAFSGTYNRGDNPDDVENTWNGKRAEVAENKPPEKVTPPQVSFSGIWKGMSGTTPMKLRLQQSGNQVAGEVQADVVGAAVLSIREGIVVAKTLRLKLGRADDKVFSGELVMDEGGKSFKGNIDGVATSGTLISGDDPVDAGAVGSPTAPISFTGVWRAKLGDTGLELIFQQTADRVTGQVRGFSYDVILRDGKVVGNTLLFTVERTDPTVLPGRAPRYLGMGTGELVMDRGSKTFTGTLLGVATSGILIGP